MVGVPSLPFGFEVLVLQLADEGRGPVLFGESVNRVRPLVAPFIVGKEFPGVYFEFPLKGDPFLDVTVLYHEVEPGTRVDSEAAAGTGPMFDWYARERELDENISCGFELDTKNPAMPTPAIHFQPRTNIGLVDPFCEAIGESERGKLYLDQAKRMPKGWPLSFFGMFRGRPGSPLRVCGYLDADVKERGAHDPAYIAEVFDQVGFTAYDDTMLSRVSALMAAAPGSLDFQFDVYPDGHLSDVFAIDAQFEIKQPEVVHASFADGPASHVMALFEKWGIADERWKLGIDATFARAIPVELEDGSVGRYAFTLMPQWIKARWSNKELQPSKLYVLGKAGLTEE